jgi:ankyrin repeat protein
MMSRLKGTAVGGVMVLMMVTGGGASADQDRLADAVKARDRAAVRTLLQQHADVNVRAADGSTALYWAAQNDDLETATMLIKAGADVNAANRYGVSPLALACVNGSVPMAEALLTASADPNSATPQGETVLMTAARTGVPSLIAALIGRGANVNAKETTRGQTALMWAAGEGHAAAIKALVDGGADLGARSRGGWTALLFAAREGQAAAVQALLDAGADVNEEQRPAGGGGRGRANGGGVNGGGGAGRGAAPAAGGPSALMLAVGSNHYELAAHLLDLGADPNAAAQGWTALHQITWMRKPGQGSNGPGPAGSGNMDSLELVRRLAEYGADLNARMTRRAPVGTTALNMIGATPFLMAARTADAPLMRLLAELGADPLLTNEDGTTPLMAAAGLGVHSPGEDPGTEREALEAVKVALALGGDVNAIDKNGDTAMHGAAYKQFPSVVQLLVDQGAVVDLWNTKNRQGWTPLRIAVGVHRGMNFRFSKATADVIARIMTAEGVSTVVEPEKVISGATK